LPLALCTFRLQAKQERVTRGTQWITLKQLISIYLFFTKSDVTYFLKRHQAMWRPGGANQMRNKSLFTWSKELHCLIFVIKSVTWFFFNFIFLSEFASKIFGGYINIFFSFTLEESPDFIGCYTTSNIGWTGLWGTAGTHNHKWNCSGIVGIYRHVHRNSWLVWLWDNHPS